jgi:hypothetical protein
MGRIAAGCTVVAAVVLFAATAQATTIQELKASLGTVLAALMTNGATSDGVKAKATWESFKQTRDTELSPPSSPATRTRPRHSRRACRRSGSRR